MIRRSRLASAAATAALILVVAGGVAGCGQGAGTGIRSGIAPATRSTTTRETAAATPGSSPATGAAARTPVWLDTVQMVSAKVGWALLWTSNPALPDSGGLSVGRTTSGGRSWSVVTPPAGSRALADGAGLLDATTAQRAWLAVTSGSGRFTLVFGTTNGGATWLGAPRVHGDDPAGIDFAAAKRGWLLESTGAAMSQDAVRLYRSSDGGARWALIAASAPSASASPAASGIPLFCDKSGLAIASARVGWITGTCNSLADAVLESADGGKHWASPSLPIPADLCQHSGCEVPAPQFAGTTTFLEISSYPAAAYLLVTANAGASWQTRRMPAGAGAYPRLTVFSARHAIAISAGAQGVIGRDFYLTTDGGQSWTAVPQGRRFGTGESFSFVSPGTGFGWNSGLTGSVQPRLLVTTNSGRSWAVIRPVLS